MGCGWPLDLVDNLEKEKKKLKDIIKSADSILEEIFESIPPSFMTGYEWDLQWNELTKEVL